MMATFTMELWEVLELEGDNGNGARIGLDRYPIFDEDYRDGLNRLIIQEYWEREIGQESVAMFRLALSRRMQQLMPYYNQLYKSQLIEFDPLSTFNLKTIRDDTTTENGEQSTEGSAKVTSGTGGRTINSDFPQTMLAGDADYASSGSDVNSTATTANDTNGTTTSNGTTDTNGSSTTTGYQGAASDLLNKLRASFLNIDMMILPQLSDCFMLVRDSGEEMLPYGYGYGMIGYGI
jgi:hypothetical protein